MVLRQQLFTRSPLIISLIPPTMYGLEWKKRQDCREAWDSFANCAPVLRLLRSPQVKVEDWPHPNRLSERTRQQETAWHHGSGFRVLLDRTPVQCLVGLGLCECAEAC